MSAAQAIEVTFSDRKSLDHLASEAKVLLRDVFVELANQTAESDPHVCIMAAAMLLHAAMDAASVKYPVFMTMGLMHYVKEISEK